MHIKSLSLSLLLASTAIRVAFFDPGKTTWKMKADGTGLEVDANGNPILVIDGKEQTVATDTISRLNAEAMGHRRNLDAANVKLKAFEDAGITDPVAAADAIATVGKFKQGELITAGKVDEVKAELTKSFEKRIADAETAAKTASGRADNMLLGQQFTGSKFISDKLIIPQDIARATFGNRFKIEGDKVVGIKPDGSPIYSMKRAGEVADFDEAIEILVNEYPNKDAILKGANNAGSGNQGGGNTGPGGKRSLTRTAFDALAPNEKAAFARDISADKAEVAG